MSTMGDRKTEDNFLQRAQDFPLISITCQYLKTPLQVRQTVSFFMDLSFWLGNSKQENRPVDSFTQGTAL